MFLKPVILVHNGPRVRVYHILPIPLGDLIAIFVPDCDFCWLSKLEGANLVGTLNSSPGSLADELIGSRLRQTQSAIGVYGLLDDRHFNVAEKLLCLTAYGLVAGDKCYGYAENAC